MTYDFDPNQTAKRLSPAARETLSELVAAYRLQLLESVYEAAPEGDISATDLLRNSVRGRSYDMESEQVRYAAEDADRARRDQALLFISSLVAMTMGMFVTFVGIGPLLGWSFLDRTTLPIMVGLGAAGFITAYATLLIAVTNRARLRRQVRELEYRHASSYKRVRDELDPDATVDSKSRGFERAGAYLTGWRDVEESLYRLGRERLGADSSRRMALSSIVLTLTRQGVLSEDVADDARWAAGIRNKLVHGEGTIAISERDIDRLARLSATLGSIGGGPAQWH